MNPSRAIARTSTSAAIPRAGERSATTSAATMDLVRTRRAAMYVLRPSRLKVRGARRSVEQVHPLRVDAERDLVARRDGGFRRGARGDPFAVAGKVEDLLRAERLDDVDDGRDRAGLVGVQRDVFRPHAQRGALQVRGAERRAAFVRDADREGGAAREERA